MINIGQYIETAINWLTNNFATFFDTLSIGIGSFIDSFQHVLYGIPFYITIAVLVILAWMKSGKGTAVFTVLGLLLITEWASGKRPCRLWRSYYRPPVSHCCWECRWVSGLPTATDAIKSCVRYWTSCKPCQPLCI